MSDATNLLWLEGRVIDRETVIDYKAALATRYSSVGVNAALAAVNGLIAVLGRHECRVRTLKIQRRVFVSNDKELSRAEYERLVAAAERLGKVCLSLLLQLMAATRLRASEVACITCEAVAVGKAESHLKGKICTILLPRKLCRKLLKYVRR